MHDKRKTAFHFMDHPGFGLIIPLIVKVRPTVIKGLTSGDWLVRLADALKGVLNYEPDFIQRDWFEGRGAGHPNFYEGYTYEQWRQACITGLNAVRGRSNFFYESYNETGVSPAYIAFEAERTHRLKAEFGIKSAVLNMGVGWSTSAHVDMAISGGLLDALRDTGSLWAEHGYMSPLGSQTWRGHNQADLPDSRFSKPIIEIANDRTIYPSTVTDWLTFRIAMTHQAMLARGYGDIIKALTEYGFDNAASPSYKNYTGGQTIGGWKECIPYWQQWGYLNGKSAARFYAEQLALGEAQMNAPGWEWLLGATIFTVGSSPASTWPIFDILNEDGSGSAVLSDFMIVLPSFEIPAEPEPIPEPPVKPELPADGCWITAWPDRVHIRLLPDATSQSLGLIEVGALRESLGTVKQDDGRIWHKLASGGYAADWVLLNNGNCEPLPEPEEPTNGNGEEPTVIEGNLLGFKIEGQPTIEQLRPMMEARKPAYCNVMVEVGEAAYVASLAQAFPDTIFGVLFNINIDFGELVHEDPATPTDFAPLYNAATTREANQEFFNPNDAWQRWRDGTNANGKKLLTDFQHLAGLSAAVRRRVLILSFFELPFDDKLTAAYIDFEKERIIQVAFDFGLGAVVLNHRGRDQNETYFQMLGSRGMHHAVKTVNDQVGHQNSSIGRTDHAGLFLELLHGPDNQAVEPDGHLSRHAKDIINQTPLYEAQDFNPVAGGDPTLLAFKILADHHRINHYLPFPSSIGGVGIPIRITSFGYDGDAGSDSYRHYHSEGKSLEGYHDNAPVWEEWGLDPVETLKKQLAYAVAQISKVPQVSGIALDNVFGGGPRDVSGVAFYDAVGPDPEPIAAFEIVSVPPHHTGRLIEFEAQENPDGAQYRWDFGDGDTMQFRQVGHVYITPGTYTVTLTVTLGELTAAMMRDIDIVAAEPEPEAPVAIISDTMPLAVMVGTKFPLSSASTGSITGHLWTFTGPDGSVKFDNGQTVEVSFPIAGIWKVSLEVSGVNGKDTTTRSITVMPAPPPPQIPTTVTFSGRILGIIPFTGVVEMS